MRYENTPGQQLDKEKTSIYFSLNKSQEARDYLLQLPGIPNMQRYDKYLGLPALVGKSRMDMEKTTQLENYIFVPGR